MTVAGSVAVVVVNFNGAAYLRRCLDAIEAQSRRPDHVIVVDNASTDGSLARRAGAVSRHSRYIANPTNVGFAAANNQAFEICSSRGVEYVALLNPDAFAAPDWLATLLGAASREPHYASWASCLLRADAPSGGRRTRRCLSHLRFGLAPPPRSSAGRRVARRSGRVLRVCRGGAVSARCGSQRRRFRQRPVLLSWRTWISAFDCA